MGGMMSVLSWLSLSAVSPLSVVFPEVQAASSTATRGIGVVRMSAIVAPPDASGEFGGPVLSGAAEGT